LINNGKYCIIILVNKYKYRAALVAIVAICTSVLLWTRLLPLVPMPSVSDFAVSVIEELLDDFETVIKGKQKIQVQEVTVEDLGEHFAESIQQVSVQASVASTQESEPIEQVFSAAEEELNSWEISYAWRIVVPSLGIRAPVLLPSMKYWGQHAWDMLEEQMQIGLNHGAVAYPHSTSPGSNGSLIIAGHSSPPTEAAEKSAYGSLFASLPSIDVGEEIVVETAASPVRYRVEKKIIVSPSMTSLLEQQYDDSILKVITCYPVGTTRDRMIILAKKVEE
jgi:LPXTG-site transpeptidase (sortase) family protein